MDLLFPWNAFSKKAWSKQRVAIYVGKILIISIFIGRLTGSGGLLYMKICVFTWCQVWPHNYWKYRSRHYCLLQPGLFCLMLMYNVNRLLAFEWYLVTICSARDHAMWGVTTIELLERRFVTFALIWVKGRLAIVKGTAELLNWISGAFGNFERILVLSLLVLPRMSIASCPSSRRTRKVWRDCLP